MDSTRQNARITLQPEGVVIHFAADGCCTIAVQVQRLAVISNRCASVNGHTTSNGGHLVGFLGKAAHTISADVGSSLIRSQAVHREATAQHQRTVIVQLTIQGEIITHQRVAAIQSCSQCTCGSIDGSAADAAAERSPGKIDTPRRSRHLCIVRHIQHTTRLRNCHGCAVSSINSPLINSSGCDFIVPGQQVLAPGNTTACNCKTIGAKGQVVPAVSHPRSISNRKITTIYHLHRIMCG